MESQMKAVVENHVIAESQDTVETGGYHYFPRTAVEMKWLQKSPRTESDQACPHGVQFYDVVIEGARYPRAAWSYEAPLPSMKSVAGRIGFWNEVQVA
jgi:uncharacterized protein (DUF427 family)